MYNASLAARKIARQIEGYIDRWVDGFDGLLGGLGGWMDWVDGWIDW